MHCLERSAVFVMKIAELALIAAVALLCAANTRAVEVDGSVANIITPLPAAANDDVSITDSSKAGHDFQQSESVRVLLHVKNSFRSREATIISSKSADIRRSLM